MSSTRKANIALAAAIGMLLLSSVTAYFSFTRFRRNQEWVRHTRDVQHLLDRYSSIAGRVGRLRTEFVDSGDASLLQQLADARAAVRGNLDSIQQLTLDNPSQQANCRQLRELTERRLSLIDQAIELKRSGKSTLESQYILQRESVADAESSERLVQLMDDEEQRLLQQREQDESDSFFAIVVVLLGSLFLSLALFLLHHRLLTNQVHGRVRAELALRSLSARLLTLQDEERRKFARELHDSIGQHLVAMKMVLSLLERKLPEERAIRESLKLLDDSISETRTISHLLHPPLLDESGLISACRWFVDGFAQRSSTKVGLSLPEAVPRFEPQVELVLFRVLQEALTNVHRHAAAARADVKLEISGDWVTLSVRDYGKGIPADALQSLREAGTAGGVGLAGMTERVREIGGELAIESDRTGTTLTARVPLRRAPANGPGIESAVQTR